MDREGAAVMNEINALMKRTPESSLPLAPGNHHSALSVNLTILDNLIQMESCSNCPSVTGLFHLASCLLESPLDSKEIKLVNPKGNQP